MLNCYFLVMTCATDVIAYFALMGLNGFVFIERSYNLVTLAYISL